jgi:hypothetical protein
VSSRKASSGLDLSTEGPSRAVAAGFPLSDPFAVSINQWKSCRLIENSVLEVLSMVRAIMSDGEIRPIEPMPADWRDGQRLRIEKADDGDMPLEEIDRDFAELAELCAASESADEDQMERALQEARRQSKDHVRQRMGLV